MVELRTRRRPSLRRGPRGRPATTPLGRAGTPSGRRGALPGRRRSTAWAGLAAAVALGGCSLPTTEPPPSGIEPAEAPVASSTPDPARDQLVAEIDRLRATVAAARDAFAGALDATGSNAARADAAAALELLVAPPSSDATDGTDDDLRPLFPSEPAERDLPDGTADQLTVTLNQAREAGGSLGDTVVDLLRDPIAGDLGAWQRDATGVLASIDATIAEAPSLEQQEAAVGELPGLGTRAIAWARLTENAASTDDATRYAERGVANLDVIIVTLDRLSASP